MLQTEELEIGGPDILTQNELARMALNAVGKPERIVHIPDWVRRTAIILMRTFTSSKTYGPFEFFMTMMAQDNIAPQIWRRAVIPLPEKGSRCFLVYVWSKRELIIKALSPPTVSVWSAGPPTVSVWSAGPPTVSVWSAGPPTVSVWSAGPPAVPQGRQGYG